MTLERLTPQARELAAVASIAGRIERALLRALRLRALPGVDATAETDLWFSDAIARRSASEIVLRTELLSALRAELVQSGRLNTARDAVVAVHRGCPPLLELEERLIYLALSGAPSGDIEASLGEAVETMRTQRDRALDVGAWALRTLPRLPDRARTTAAAWSLAFASETTCSYAIELDGTPPSDAIFVDEDVGTTTVHVRRTGDQLVFGDGGTPVTVAATTPRIVLVQEAGTTQVVAVPAGQARTATLGGGEIILGNLLGQRWALRTMGTAATPATEHAENGRWVLVDGTDDFRIPPHHEQLARELGVALARSGFSLITLGLKGVSHVVGRAFADELQRQGYTSCIYRLLHVVPEGGRPDFWERGRALFPPSGYDEVADAVAHADAVVMVGLSAKGARVVEHARQRGIGVRSLVESDIGATISDLSRLLGEVDAKTRPAASLAHEAALALDERDLGAYNDRLARIAREVRSQLELLPLDLLITDLRPSYRLVGYLSGERFNAPELLGAWRQEYRTANGFWETRTLWFALEAMRSLQRTKPDDERSAVAAALISTQRLLDSQHRIDPDGEMKHLLDAIAGESLGSELRRARELGQRAGDYERTRREQRPSAERTQSLDKFVDDIARRFAQGDVSLEASTWFSSGSAGGRIVGLSLLVGSPSLQGIPIAADAISSPQSAFEQYTALRIAHELVDRLEDAPLRDLRDRLERQRSEGFITQQDRSRWERSNQILDRIRDRLGDAMDFGGGTAIVIGIDNYRDVKLSSAATRDAEALSQMFSNVGYERVFLYTRERATFAAVAEAISSADPDELLVVAFSGWAVPSSDGLRVHLFDRAVTVSEIVKLNGPRRDLLVLLDCNSAALSFGELRSSSSSKATVATVAILAGAAAEQIALDGGSNGAFTAALLKAFEDLRLRSLLPFGVRDLYALTSQYMRSVEVSASGDAQPQRPELLITGAAHDLAIGLNGKRRAPPPRRGAQRKLK